VLAAAAARTERIRLTSAVTVLGSDDPVRVFQQFATLDLLSGGRAEIMAGRGSFIESFPLFGYDLADYDELFAEKLDLLLRLRESRARHLVGAPHRPPLDDQGVYPRPVQEPLPVWIAVGGTPSRRCARARSACRWRSRSSAGAGALRALRRAAPRGGAARRPRPAPRRSASTRTASSPTTRRGRRRRLPGLRRDDDRIGRERGWPPMTREQFEASRDAARRELRRQPGAGVEKILFQHEIFGHERFLLQFTVGPLPHARCCARSSCSAPRWRRRRSRPAAHWAIRCRRRERRCWRT
jgi:alkanesulfonate monooxygenase SsuD/methylene tetrahydromethanopterin reductase-like flavin-dependent oxidoreductase (luciferase family)